MSKTYKTVALEIETYELIEKAREMFLKSNKPFKGIPTSNGFIIDRALKSYCDII